MKTLLSQRDTHEILSRVRAVHPDSPRRWGKMSAHQMICHVSDGCRLYMGLMTAAQPGFPYPSRVLKWSALWVPIQWPHGTKTLPEVDQHIGGTPPTEFARDQAALADLLERFTRTPRDFNWPAAHPFLGRMSERDWMRLGYLHADHHLRQFDA